MTSYVMRFLDWKRPKLHPMAWYILFGTLAARTGFYMTMPFLAIYLASMDGMTPGFIGAIIGISFLVGTFSSFFGGYWSDRFGRYKVMIASMFLWGFVFCCFALAHSIWLFFLLSALNGFCRNVFEPAAKALLSDIVPSENHASIFNLRYFFINIGGSLGPLCGVYLGSSYSTTPFLLTGAVYVVYALVIWRGSIRYQDSQNTAATSPGEHTTLKQAGTIILSDKAFRYILLGNVLVVAAYAHLDSTFAQYISYTFAGETGIRYLSYLMVANGVSVLVLQYPLAKVTARLAPAACLRIGCLCFGLGIGGFGLSHSIEMLIACIVLFTMGEILCFVTGDLMINRIAPPHLRGAYFGASGLQFIGQSAGAWFGGLLLGTLGFHQGGLTFGILMVAALLAYPFFYLGERFLAATRISQKSSP